MMPMAPWAAHKARVALLALVLVLAGLFAQASPAAAKDVRYHTTVTRSFSGNDWTVRLEVYWYRRPAGGIHITNIYETLSNGNVKWNNPAFEGDQVFVLNGNGAFVWGRFGSAVSISNTGCRCALWNVDLWIDNPHARIDMSGWPHLVGYPDPGYVSLDAYL